MAKRVKIYQTVRSIHFYAAAITSVFLLLFFITGLLLTRHHWFQHEEEESTIQDITVDIPDLQSGEGYAHWVKKELKLVGKIDWINQKKDGSIQVEIVTPQRIHMATIYPARDQIQIEKSTNSAYDIITVYHRMHGYGGGMIYDFYLLGMDLASLSLIIFSLTGLYLWLKVLKRKWLGVLFLGLGFGYTSWVIMTFLLW